MSTFKHYGSEAIRRALAGLGLALGEGHSVELLVVGGAAGLLANVLPGSVTTSDVDAMHFRMTGTR